MTDQSDRFRALHEPGRPLVLPNAWDHATAAQLVAAGFSAIGTTSLGVAAAHGLPDAHGLAREETLALAGRLARLPCLFTVDVEAGFSEDPGEVGELAAELSRLGAAGINLEDGRPDGALAETAHQCELIRTVKEKAPALFLNARVDTLWLRAGDLDATCARALRYLDAGADGIFVPGLADEHDIAALLSQVDAPLNALFLPGRHTVTRLAELGVARISTGSLLFRSALHAVVRIASAIRDGGAADAEGPSYEDVQRLVPPA